MGRELIVPDSYYLIDDETLELISTKGKRKILKPDTSRSRGNRNELSYRIKIGDTFKHKRLPTIVAAAKYGRWPQPFEQVCHEDGNPENNSLDNITIKDVINNFIDELFIGRKETTEEYIDLAIIRLMDFKSRLATLKSC